MDTFSKGPPRKGVKNPPLHVFLEYLVKYNFLYQTWLVVNQFRVAGYDGDIFRYIEDVFGRLNVRKTQKFVKNMIFKTKNQDLKRIEQRTRH